MNESALRQLTDATAGKARIVAISKFHPASEVQAAYDAGQRVFGESRVQELLAKQQELPDDIEWHFIGHLQTNKVRQLIGHVQMIQSVDSPRLLRLIDSESRRADVVTNVLLQVHVAKEETKFGFSPDELIEYINSGEWRDMSCIHLRGVMGMATNTDDTTRIADDFRRIRQAYEQLKEITAIPCFDTLSMGMTHDWQTALAEGANTLRIGSAIFGPREY